MKIENENEHIASMLKFDIAVLLIFLLAFLGISGFVFIQVLNIAADAGAGSIFVAAFILAIVVLTCTIAWLIRYLCRCKRHVYEDELIFKEIMKNQKEDQKS